MNFVNVVDELDWVLRGHTLQTTNSYCVAVEQNYGKSVSWSKGFNQEFQCISDKFYFLARHWPTVINNTDQINTCPCSSTCLQGDHSREVNSVLQFHHRPLCLYLDVNFCVFLLLLNLFNQRLIIIVDFCWLVLLLLLEEVTVKILGLTKVVRWLLFLSRLLIAHWFIFIQVAIKSTDLLYSLINSDCVFNKNWSFKLFTAIHKNHVGIFSFHHSYIHP